MGLSPLPSWNRAGQFTPKHSDEAPELLQSRWARAGEPDALARLYAARLESERNRGGVRLVLRRVPCPDKAPEQLRPADPLGLAPQQSAGLVADHPEENTVGAERAEQFTAARQRAQPVEMDRAEDIEIDLPRLLPSVAEMKRKALPQAEPDA